MGYPPLVTPTSQIVGIQAVLNVLADERYKQVTQEVKNYLLGLYGRPPAPVDEKIRKKIIGKEKPITARPADMLPPELEKLKAEAHQLGILHREEDLVTYALYPQVAVKFLRGELKEEAMPSPSESVKGTPAADLGPMEFAVDVDGEIFNVKVSSVAGGKPIEVEKSRQPAELPAGAVVAPMQGMMLGIKVKAGDKVKVGDVVVVIEAMKMQNEVHSTVGGTVKEIMTFQGEVINAGDLLLVVE